MLIFLRFWSIWRWKDSGKFLPRYIFPCSDVIYRLNVAESINPTGHKRFKTNNGITYLKLELIGPQFQGIRDKNPTELLDVSLKI